MAAVFLRLNRREEAAELYGALVERLSAQSPRSQVVGAARTRLGAIYYGKRDLLRARDLYRDVLAAGGAYATRAAVQLAGVEFEVLQRKAKGEGVSPAEWEAVRAACRQAMDLPGVHISERVRAHTMLVESFCWQGLSEQAVEEAYRFMNAYPDGRFKQDIATVCFFAGEELQKLGRYEEALGLFRWIVNAYGGKKSIWPGGDHLPRTYYQVWSTLRRAKADPAQIAAAAEALFAAFPDSPYSRHIRIVNRQEAQYHAR